MPLARALPSVTLLFLAFSALACSGDSLTAPGTGTIEITTSTTGTEPDPDGYTVQVDDGTAQAIGTAASVQSTDVSPGDHTVELGGLAANCAVSGDNPRTVSVAAGQTATVSFTVTCGATTGGLQVTSTTTGPSPDADGYAVTIDGSEHGTLGATGTLNVDGLAPGDHAVGISGVAANCQVQGGNPRTATITAGTSTPVAFAVTCAAPPASVGTLKVITTTAGPAQDQDGYSVALDGGATQPIGVNATVTLANVAAGSHTVALSSFAANCAVSGDNPRSVSVAAGQTATVSFTVTCGATTGSLQVTSTTTGPSPDADGYAVTVDGTERGRLSATGTLNVDGLAVGDHAVGISGLAANCTVTGDNPRTVTVTAGATASAAFSVTCSSIGVTRWTEMTGVGADTMSGVWGTSATNVFAVGGQQILHYDGTRWTEQFRTQLALGRDAWGLQGGFKGVWGTSSTDVFAVGGAFTTGQVLEPDQAMIFHYNGTGWTEMARFSQGGTDQSSLNAVWGSSPTDVFAVGAHEFESSSRTLIVHFDGEAWTPMSLPDNATNLGLYGVWGTSARDVYAVGMQGLNNPSGITGALLHYDGTNWTKVAERRGSPAVAVWGSASNDVFVATAFGSFLHYNGSTWSPMATPDREAGNTWDIWGTSPTDLYAVGGPFAFSGGKQGAIYHYDGRTWVEQTGGASAPLFGIWGSSPTDVYAVGGTILHGTP